MKYEEVEAAEIIPARNSSCGKVMFSQACVSHSVHREVPSLAGGAILSRGCHP